MKINRRGFLKGVGAGGAGCALSQFIPGALALQPAKALEGKEQLTASLCEMCSFRCPIQAKIVNGKTVFIQGNENAPQQGTRVCARGGSGINMLNDPHRIVKPMKRVGPRGAGEWQVISWEQAYKEIAERLNDIKAKYGPESVAFTSKSGSLAGHLFQLASVYGSPNTFTHATTCPAGKAIAAKVMMGGDLGLDLGNSDYIVSFGHNLYEGIEVAETHELMEAQMKGAKLVSFDPRLSVVSSKADEWFAIRPATDLAVLMAMAHVMIKEDLYDKAFVARYTIGLEQLKEAVKETTPEWAAAYADVPAEAIVRITRELAAAAPHALVSPGHRATFNKEEIDMRRMIFTLNALLGNVERRGGLFKKKNAGTYNKLAGEKVAPSLAKLSVKGPEITAKRLDAIDPQFDYINKGGGIMQAVMTAIETKQPYEIKAWISSRQNIMQTLACRPALEAAFNKLDLLVSCDVYLTETAAYADYFLPDTTYLERDEDVSDSSGLNPAYSVRQQVVNPIGDTKPSWMIWKELGEAMGLGEYYQWNDMKERQFLEVNQDKALYQELLDKGFLSYGIPLMLREPESVAAFVAKYPAAQSKVEADGTLSNELTFGSPSGLIELYSEKLEKLAPGYGVPEFRNFKIKEDDELFYIQGKVAVHTNGATQYVPLLSEMMPENLIWIHTDVAKAKGIKTGDKVSMENHIGKEIGHAFVTSAIHPNTVFTYMGFGAKAGANIGAARNGVHCGNLLSHEISPVCGTDVHTSGVKINRVS